MSDASLPGRWVYRGLSRTADDHHCRYCGRLGSRDCEAVACLLCESAQCHGNGSGNGTCRVCCYGWLPGWFQPERTCGYARCDNEAIANAPRVRRVCRDHADRATVRLIGGRGTKTLTEVARDAVAHRDSGKGWEHWRFVTLPLRPA